MSLLQQLFLVYRVETIETVETRHTLENSRSKRGTNGCFVQIWIRTAIHRTWKEENARGTCQRSLKHTPIRWPYHYRIYQCPQCQHVVSRNLQDFVGLIYSLSLSLLFLLTENSASWWANIQFVEIIDAMETTIHQLKTSKQESYHRRLQRISMNF